MRDVLRAPTVAGMSALVGELRGASGSGTDRGPGGEARAGAPGDPSDALVEYEEGEL